MCLSVYVCVFCVCLSIGFSVHFAIKSMYVTTNYRLAWECASRRTITCIIISLSLSCASLINWIFFLFKSAKQQHLRFIFAVVFFHIPFSLNQTTISKEEEKKTIISNKNIPIVSFLFSFFSFFFISFHFRFFHYLVCTYKIRTRKPIDFICKVSEKILIKIMIKNNK